MAQETLKEYNNIETTQSPEEEIERRKKERRETEYPSDEVKEQAKKQSDAIVESLDIPDTFEIDQPMRWSDSCPEVDADTAECAIITISDYPKFVGIYKYSNGFGYCYRNEEDGEDEYWSKIYQYPEDIARAVNEHLD